MKKQTLPARIKPKLFSLGGTDQPIFPLAAWFGSITSFVVLDLVWLGAIMSKQYSQTLGYLATIKDGAIVFDLPVGLTVQIVIATALFLVAHVAMQSAMTKKYITLYTAFVGFAIYFTYDFTNLSFIRNWPLQLSVIDVLWGTFQGMLASIYVPLYLKVFGKK